MKEIKVEIKGITAMIMDSLKVEDIIKPPPSIKKYTEEVMQAMAEKALYKDDEGLFIPNRNVKKCLIQGAKMGRIRLAGRQNLYPFIEASVFIEPLKIRLTQTKPDNYIEIPMRRKDGNVIPKRLPLFLKWELTFIMFVYDDEIVDKVKEALEIAGLSVGLGNQRPEYGRFEVTEWKVKK
jgi:hypothetical protein